MRPSLPVWLSLIALICTALPASADTASGLPTGKRQHKPLTVTKNWEGYRPHARALQDRSQRAAALRLIDALEAAKRRQIRAYDRLHRLQRGRKSRSAQNNQTDMNFLRERARRNDEAKGGNAVAMEELTIANEGLQLVKTEYNRLRQTIGIRTACVRACDAARRRCESRCRPRGACACVVVAADCLLSKLRARRCGRPN